MAGASGSGVLAQDKLKEEELDYSSSLPDELVVKVLSSLSFKEAARTSVISKRWINFWKSTDLVLDFDYMEELMAIDREGYRKRKKTEDRHRAINQKSLWLKNWVVNRVIEQLEQHNCSSKIMKFRVAVSLTDDYNSEGDIDRWLKFAISNRVESLHLAFHVFEGMSKHYTFSEDCYNHIKTPAGLSQIKSLRSLSLRYVRARGEIVEHIVANCPSLEVLVLRETSGLKRLSLVGSSDSPLALKHLEISCCLLEFLEIAYAPRFSRFIYNSHLVMKELRLDKCPNLVDLTVDCCALHDRVIEIFRSLSNCASQLRFLLLNVRSMIWPLSGLAEHTCLERLAVKVRDCNGILGLIPLINQCPRLHTLQVSFFIYASRSNPRVEVDHVKIKQESVKVVEIYGFSEHVIVLEFLEYVMSYFVGLERIVINRNLTTSWSSDADPLYATIPKNPCTQIAKDIALEFKSKASSAIEFIVI